MTKFFEQLTDIEKQKYIKDINREITLDEHLKLKDFISNNTLYVTNIKTNPIKVKSKDGIIILDSSKNRWFILCIDNKIQLISKKNIIIHTSDFDYTKRDATFSKKYKIKKVDYLIEYVDNIGANLSLNIKNYNDKIGKSKWSEEDTEIANMTLNTSKDSTLNGYTYNSDSYSLCIIGKGFEKQKDILL